MMRKDVIFAFLALFGLYTLIFGAIPIGSQLPYDPWIDINEDGKINMYDVGYTAQRFGATGDPTKNVNVTNWPQDRPLTVKKGIERIAIIDSLAGYGVCLGKGTVPNPYYCYFVYDFEPKGPLMNVFEIHVNYIWREDTVDAHWVNVIFRERPGGGSSSTVHIIGPQDTMPTAHYTTVSVQANEFNFSVVHQGINELMLARTDTNGNYIYFSSLVLFIEYYYKG